ncbi:iron-sulfur cluster assembly scaffold protein [Nitrosopumilus sp. K4]|uniref:iron-sulfur cluster assembly scaffold protein n=1 Tax=Nitrosopumilus sp. K4 TaxID=2795383 RepID=UPI001BA7CD19|nr:iron-sulfur cluster assembly scaffold protein [Nitrosopumilus sp. K4]QUC63995.1 iron-sulfur cluster assembly scaffold protein [Nitrosopumilus sp. K4]
MSSNADIYHEMIIDYSRNPINYGEIENPDVTFHDSNPLCGDSIDIDMKIDENKVSDIKFHGKGCAICMACSSVLTEITKGKSIDEVRNIEKNDVLGELGLENLQAVRIKCALLSLKVLKSALYSYLGKHMKDSKDVDKLKEEAANLY